MPILIRRLLMSALNIQGSPLLQRVSGAHCRPLVSLLELPTQLHGCRSSRMRVLQQSALPQWRPEPPERAVFPQPRPHQLPQTAGNLRCRVVPSASSAEVLQRVQVCSMHCSGSTEGGDSLLFSRQWRSTQCIVSCSVCLMRLIKRLCRFGPCPFRQNTSTTSIYNINMHT